MLFGGGLVAEGDLKLEGSLPPFADLFPMGPGAVIVASVGRCPQLAHTKISTHPEVLRPISFFASYTRHRTLCFGTVVE